MTVSNGSSGAVTNPLQGTESGAFQPVERLGRYGLLAALGQGGMGTIHLAVAGGLGEFRKLLVVKELRRDLARNGKFVEMFVAEAKLAARLNHPNIVQTLEAGQDGERYYLAMEFLDGQPLTEVLKRAANEPYMSLSMRLQVLCEVLAGLHYAHELCDFDDSPFKIVHRDVSPHNVFVTYHGQVKVVDFGIAKAVDTETGTAAGVFKGKFSYAAPEQVKGHSVDRRADVFAAGVMLWEMLANRRFAPGGLTEAAAEARVSGTEPRVASVAPEVDPELAAICDRAIAVDPADRYPSAEAFRADLLSHLLAQGELAQQAQLGDLIRIKFAAERLAMHRLIHAQAKRHTAFEYIGYLGDSIVRSVPRSETTRRSRPLPVVHGADGEYPAHTSQTDPSGQSGQSAHSSQSVHRSQGGWGQHDRSPVRPLAPWMTPGDNDNLAHGTSPSQALLMRRPRRAKAMWLLLPATAAFCGAYIWMRAQLEPPTPVAFSTQSASSTAEHPAESPAAPTLDTASAQAAANRALSESGVPGSTDADGAARAASSDESARNLPHRTRRGSRVVNVSTNAAQRASSANALARGADGEGRSSAGRLAKPGADDEGRGASSSRELSVQAGESLHARPRQQGPRQIELEDPFRISKRRPENTRTIEREDPFR